MARVLIADSYESLRYLLTEMVTRAGHDVIAVAQNGNEAWRLYKLHRPDMVIVDSHMCNSDGQLTALHIRNAGKDTRIIVCEDDYSVSGMIVEDRRWTTVRKSVLVESLIQIL